MHGHFCCRHVYRWSLAKIKAKIKPERTHSEVILSWTWIRNLHWNWSDLGTRPPCWDWNLTGDSWFSLIVSIWRSQPAVRSTAISAPVCPTLLISEVTVPEVEWRLIWINTVTSHENSRNHFVCFRMVVAQDQSPWNFSNSLMSARIWKIKTINNNSYAPY